MTKNSLHEALASLSPTTPDSLPLPSKSAKTEDLNNYITNLLSSAQTIIDSLPTSSSTTPETTSSEWKLQSKKDAIFTLYKLNCKDGRGNWFGRRSVHRGVGFGRFKRGLQKEFGGALEEGRESSEEVTEREEAVKRRGNVRGIGVERRVEGLKGDEGSIDVYHLKAQFPGPSAPRDFITCCITSELPHSSHPSRNQFTMISRPLRDHPETEVKKDSGFVRGEYESIEFIREIDEPSNTSAQSNLQPPSTDGQQEGNRSAIEWIMVTRSNPGGNVPKWMVERGTPGSIVQDAEKFLKWIETAPKELLTPRPSADGERPVFDEVPEKPKTVTPDDVNEAELSNTGLVDRKQQENVDHSDEDEEYEDATDERSGVVPGLVSGVSGLAKSAAEKLNHFTPSTRGERGSEDKDESLDSRPQLPQRSTSNLTFRTAPVSPPASPSLTPNIPVPSSPPLVHTPSTSSISLLRTASPDSLSSASIAKLSSAENGLLLKHHDLLGKIQEKAAASLNALDIEEKALKTESFGNQPLDSPILTKDQKNQLKKQIRIKDKRKKVRDRLEKDVRKESRRYEKEVEKVRERALKDAKKEGKELKKKEVRAEKKGKDVEDAGAANVSASETKSDADSEFASSIASGGFSKSSLSKILREKDRHGKEEELRNVVKGLTQEVVELRRYVGELEGEIAMLKKEKKHAVGNCNIGASALDEDEDGDGSVVLAS